MKISTRGRYALRVMVDLAQHTTSTYISLKHIGARQQITQKYLEQIMVLLCRAHLVTSARGVSGGYKLARAPSAYTAGEILRATEGSLAPVTCVEKPFTQCVHHPVCTTFPFWEGLADVITQYVDGITLEQLAQSRPPAANAPIE